MWKEQNYRCPICRKISIDGYEKQNLVEQQRELFNNFLVPREYLRLPVVYQCLECRRFLRSHKQILLYYCSFCHSFNCEIKNDYKSEQKIYDVQFDSSVSPKYITSANVDIVMKHKLGYGTGIRLLNDKELVAVAKKLNRIKKNSSLTPE